GARRARGNALETSVGGATARAPARQLMLERTMRPPLGGGGGGGGLTQGHPPAGDLTRRGTQRGPAAPIRRGSPQAPALRRRVGVTAGGDRRTPPWRRRTRRAGVVALVAVGVLWGIQRWIQPIPPHRLVMTTGAPGGALAATGERYRQVLAREHVQVELRPS